MIRARRFGFPVVAAAVLAASACALRNVSSFADRGFEISRYRTYSWAADEPRATGDPRLDNNSLFQSCVRMNIEKELAKRGLERATSASVDLVVHYYASVTQRLEVNGPHQPYDVCRDCTPRVYDAGTLVIDLVDAHTNVLVWRGWAEGSIDGLIDDQPLFEGAIREGVARILARLPRPL
jgi:hypothetical protein